jgi:hypothetical protein
MTPLLLAAFLLLLLPADEVKSVAMVVAVDGDVRVRTGGGAARPARVLVRVFPGDTIEAREKATVTLLIFATGRHERVLPGKTAKVGAAGCEPSTAVQSQPGSAAAVRSIQGVEALAGGGAGVVVRSRDLPRQCPRVTPMYGSVVATQKPDFSWAPPGAGLKATSYRVDLLSASRGEIWSATSPRTKQAYPASQKALKKGQTYYWKVTAILADKSRVAVAESKFKTASDDADEDLAEVDKLVRGDGPDGLLLAASIYQSLEMYDDALRLFEQLCRRYPRQPYLRAALADYYERAGRAEDARKELKAAVEHGYPLPKRQGSDGK